MFTRLPVCSWSSVRWMLVCAVVFVVLVAVGLQTTSARNISQYRDVISTSAPSLLANHTLQFVTNVAIPVGGYIDIVPPPNFTIATSSVYSELRNVELLVDGVRRDVGPVANVTDDEVTIVPGSPGAIRYTLNSTVAIAADSDIEIRIGNHTSVSEVGYTEFSTSTGTTTVPADQSFIQNASATGTHAVSVNIFDAGANELANAQFLIALVDRVGVGPVDTTEDVPPERSNGLPGGELSGVSINIEISLETNEFSICRYSLLPDIPYGDMLFTFSNTGLIFHSQVVPVVPNSVNIFYVRCMDDEGNINIDDFIIQFTVNAQPTGSSNTEGDVSGDGTGSGNDGGGSGSGSGGDTGDSDGVADTEGGTSGGGGSGGGGGGGGGGGSGGGGGGGFESSDGPFRSGDGQVTITGVAFPRARVTVLVDGKEAETATANADGTYTATIEGIARGAYTFGIFATDAAGGKTTTFSTSFTVSGARESALSNIILPPSILISPNPVNPGQALTMSGYTLPNAVVTLENEKDKSAATRKSYTITANSAGVWTQNIDTGGFTAGTYKARLKAVSPSGVSSNFSLYTLYGVGGPAQGSNNSDLSRDGRVNLTDFSILLFWWNSAGGDSEPPADISGDGRVNLTDFSILLFNWTG